MSIADKLINRRSERNFFPNKEIPEEIINKFKAVVNNSPTSVNGNQFSAIFVRDKKDLETLATINWGQKHISDASLFVIFVVDRSRILSVMSEEDYNSLGAGARKHELLRGAIDATIAAAHLEASALDLGIGATYIGGLISGADKIREHFNLTDNQFSVLGLTMGYPEKQMPIKPKPNKVLFDRYDQEKVNKDITSYVETSKPYFEKGGRAPWDISTPSFVKSMKDLKVNAVEEFENGKVGK